MRSIKSLFWMPLFLLILVSTVCGQEEPTAAVRLAPTSSIEATLAVTVAPTNDNPLAALWRMSRSERRLAREVVGDASKAVDMRRFEFMRAVNQGDQACVAELKCSLAMHPDLAEIDIDRLQEILAMILEFIKAFMAIFALL